MMGIEDDDNECPNDCLLGPLGAGTFDDPFTVADLPSNCQRYRDHGANQAAFYRMSNGVRFCELNVPELELHEPDLGRSLRGPERWLGELVVWLPRLARMSCWKPRGHEYGFRSECLCQLQQHGLWVGRLHTRCLLFR